MEVDVYNNGGYFASKQHRVSKHYAYVMFMNFSLYLKWYFRHIGITSNMDCLDDDEVNYFFGSTSAIAESGGYSYCIVQYFGESKRLDHTTSIFEYFTKKNEE